MWAEGLVRIVGDREEQGGKYVVANVDIPRGKEAVTEVLVCTLVLSTFQTLKYSGRGRQS